MKANLSRTIITFVVLTTAGVCLVILGQGSADKAVSVVLPFLGAAIFGSALTYFLFKVG